MAPPFVQYDTPVEYKTHYEVNYCQRPIMTFDGINVFFGKDKFEHAFYESSDRRGSKDTFSDERAKRINWIKDTLENPNAVLYQGWDFKTKQYKPDGRVSVVYGDFVVVIRLSLNKSGVLKGNFVTCYEADNSISKIKSSPLWDKKECLDYLK
ncbi:MAG: hypothetical protein M0P91_01825 [Sulfuricurvum sp.]|jgi:hypothetical protein|uniref:hypothetical protein n=1 Tax=Sulfuricurvum sp. TaxID=2025608 RepID=UPI0025FFCC5E|nr:hypothetical protein [Sulfuricurvum sp.]MCK9371909.1 hypothetical protein [Sulfuricurvum sp.]